MTEFQQYAFSNAFARAEKLASRSIRKLHGGWTVGLSVNK